MRGSSKQAVGSQENDMMSKRQWYERASAADLPHVWRASGLLCVVDATGACRVRDRTVAEVRMMVVEMMMHVMAILSTDGNVPTFLVSGIMFANFFEPDASVKGDYCVQFIERIEGTESR